MRSQLMLLLLLLVSLDLHALDLDGRVVDVEGKAIPSAAVSIYMAAPRTGVSAICPSCYRDCGKRELTNKRGEFRVSRLDDSLLFRVLAVADGYEPAFANKVDPKSGPLKIELKRRDPGDADKLVRGRVVDPKGKPVVGATVEFHAIRMGRSMGFGAIPGVEAASITDGTGVFQMKIPKTEAKLDVLVRARNFAPKLATELAPAREPETITLSEGAAVTGRLVRDGKPVAGARVGLVQRSRRSDFWLGTDEIATDRDGRFLLLSVTPEKYYVSGFMHDALFPARPVDVGSDGAKVDVGTIEVAPGHRVSGRVLPPLGKTLPPDLKVSLARAQTTDFQVTTVGPDGTFAFTDVPAEPVELFIRGARLTDGERSVDLKVDGDMKDVVLELQ